MDQALPVGWAKQENALARTIQCKDFVEALALLLAVGKLSENADHHPDVDLRFNKIRLSLSTHSAGRTITSKDFSLAEEINGLTDHDTRPIVADLRARFAA